MSFLIILTDLPVIWLVEGRRLAAANLALFVTYITLRMIWPVTEDGSSVGILILCIVLAAVFALNIRMMLITALPKISKLQDKHGESMRMTGLGATPRSFALIVVAYIATLAFGFLFLTELMQLSANMNLISCLPDDCDEDRMALTSRVLSGALNGKLHISATNVFGQIVLLLHSIMNVVLLTLLIPVLLAFRD